MKRIGWMFLVVLGLAGLMYAQSSTNPMNLSGTLCQSNCVTASADNTRTCDPRCTDKSGDVVLVDDQGNVRQIANQDVCMSHVGKHVKMTAVPSATPSAAAEPTERQREESLRVLELHNEPGGG